MDFDLPVKKVVVFSPYLKGITPRVVLRFQVVHVLSSYPDKNQKPTALPAGSAMGFDTNIFNYV